MSVSSCSKVDQELHFRVSLRKLRVKNKPNRSIQLPSQQKNQKLEARKEGKQVWRQLGYRPKNQKNFTKSLKFSHFYNPLSVNPLAVKLKMEEDLLNMLESSGK